MAIKRKYWVKKPSFLHVDRGRDFRIAFKEALLKRLKAKSILLTTLLKEYSKLEEEVIIVELKKLLQENIICKEDGKIKLND